MTTPVDENKTQETLPKEHSNSEHGTIAIHDNVISMIAQETARKVPGVLELSGSFVDGIAGMIGKKDRSGIRVEKENEEIRAIDLTVILEYGAHIPDICQQLQISVKDAVEKMTGNKIKAINVNVAGVRDTSDKKPKSEKE